MPNVGRPTRARTRLAELRVARGVSQQQMSVLTGIAPATYIRLERGENDSPNLRYLANCALVLDCSIDDLIEDDWRQWRAFDQITAPAPPGPEVWERVAKERQQAATRNFGIRTDETRRRLLRAAAKERSDQRQAPDHDAS